METTIAISSQPPMKLEEVPVKVDPVARSIAREDAFMKPGSIGKGSGNRGVRVRLTNQRPPGRPKRRKRDPRDVRFW